MLLRAMHFALRITAWLIKRSLRSFIHPSTDRFADHFVDRFADRAAQR